MDKPTLGLLIGVVAVHVAAYVVGELLKRHGDRGIDPAIVESFRVRVRAWLLLWVGLALAFIFGRFWAIALFGGVSFWALREFITLTPTRPGDHRALFWVFFLFTPLQFVLVGLEGHWFFNPESSLYLGMSSYDLYSIVIPIYAFLFIPARVAMSGDAKRFLERTAKIQAGLLICVYCFSFAPALLTLDLDNVRTVRGDQAAPDQSEEQLSGEDRDEEVSPDDTQVADKEAGGRLDGQSSSPEEREEDPSTEGPAATTPEQTSGSAGGAGRNVRLLLFLVLMAQLSDALQYAWSRLPIRHVIAPSISPSRTWEGLLGGLASVTLVGTALWFTTPFKLGLVALLSLVIGLMSFAGGLTMSAIKRDRGVKDYGTLVEGHGGVLDRIDSICFAAPVFFHVVRLFLDLPTG